MVLYSALNASVIFFVKNVIDNVFTKAQALSRGEDISYGDQWNIKDFFSKNKVPVTGSPAVPIENEKAMRYLLSSLLMISVFLIVVYLLKGMFWYIRKYMMLYIGEKVVLDLRNSIYTHIQNLSMKYFDSSKTGEIMSRITNDVTLVQQTVSNAGTQIIQEPLNFIFALGILFYLNWKMTLIAIVAVIGLVYPVSILSNKIKKASKTSQRKIGDLTSIMQEIIQGIRIVKAFNMEEYEIQRFKSVNREYFNAMMKGNRAWALLTPSNEFLASIAISLAIIAGGFQIAEGEMSTGTFFAYFFALFSLYQPTRTLTEAFASIKKSIPAIERIKDILEEKIKVREADAPKPLKTLGLSINFNRVSFSYNEGNEVLKDVDFEISKGLTYAFVGESGAGKSTVGNLILRFYDVTAGSITIDGTDIRKINIGDLRRLIGYVSQDTFLFNDTIKNNITYGHGDISFREVERAAQVSGSAEFIEALPEGYDTVIGERGYALSGGQRQRIAIARALIKDPQVLILDEATSALDSESEKLVQNALNELMKGRTNIIIAHRLSTIINADLIYVMSGGTIAESGKHADLLSKEGLYHKLYNIK